MINFDSKYTKLVEIIENEMSKIGVDGGDSILFELNSELDTLESLEFISWYLHENGYDTQFSNTDVYRIMRTDPRRE